MEREEISRGLRVGDRVLVIAARLGRAPSSISREIERNGGRKRYRAVAADARAEPMAERPKTCKLARNEALRTVVAEKLRDDWSPDQISGWLKATYPGNESMNVSHEILHEILDQTLYVQARRALERELQKHVRMRASTPSTAYSGSPGSVGRPSVRQSCMPPR